MTKREIKKKGYQEIIKNGRTHQSVYEELKTTRPAFNKTIAEHLGETPSVAVRSKWQIWLTIYIALTGVTVLIRVLGVFVLLEQKVAPLVILIAVLLSLVLPGLGIYGALKYKLELLKTTSIIILLFTFRGIGKMEMDITGIIVLSLVGTIVFLGLFLPYKMKTSFKTTIVKKEVDGKMLTDYDIQFEDGQAYNNDDLLDSDLV
ncbi:MAG: hypothetical protein GQ574_25045 [Crocinitomix sp.]|nr:hypothetical protein [Crocinitomix sp.]